MRVITPGGVFRIRWDERGSATAMAQLPFFAEYLNAPGPLADWVRKIDIEDAGKAKVKRRGRKSNLHEQMLLGHFAHPPRGADDVCRRPGGAHKQAESALIDHSEATKNWEYTGLVCDTPYKLDRMGQLCRDRADCRDGQSRGFDEIKNQWGWGGYSTHDIERCALSARAVALIYNWWSCYVRLASPKNRMEAITSRPKLLSAVGRVTSHAGQSKILLPVMHESVEQIKQLLANVRSGIRHVSEAAPQWVDSQRRVAMVRFIVARILAAKPTFTPRPMALPSRSLRNPG